MEGISPLLVLPSTLIQGNGIAHVSGALNLRSSGVGAATTLSHKRDISSRLSCGNHQRTIPMHSDSLTNQSLSLDELHVVRLQGSPVSLGTQSQDSYVLGVILADHFNGQCSRVFNGSSLFHKHQGIGEGGGRHSFPYIIEVVPVQAGSNVGLAHGGQVIINLEPFLVHDNGLDLLHDFQFGSSNFFHLRTVGTNFIEPGIVKTGPVIDQLQVAHEVSLFHVESSGQSLHIEPGIVEGVHENVLVVSGGGSVYARSVVVGGHKGQQVGITTELGGGIRRLRRVNLNRDHFALGNSLNQQVLEEQILVIVCGSGKGTNQPGNQVSNTGLRSEGHSQVLILDSHRILYTPVHSVESGTDIGNRAFQLSGSSFLSRELSGLGQVYENLLNGFTGLQIPLLEFGILVVKGDAVDPNQRNPVDQGIQEFVCKGRRAKQHIPHSRDVSGFGNLRDLVLVLIGRIRTNGIDDIHRGGVQGTQRNSSGHILSSFLS
nr:MAG TPA: hypothetical protein [Caudoviricetes sp.]